MSIVFPTNEPIEPNLRKLAIDIKRRQLPRDYARCPGKDLHSTLICSERESCLRYLSDDNWEEDLTWFLPNLKIRDRGCEEYIGE